MSPARTRLWLIDALVVITIAGVAVIAGELTSLPYVGIPLATLVALWAGRNS